MLPTLTPSSAMRTKNGSTALGVEEGGMEWQLYRGQGRERLVEVGTERQASV